MSGVCAFSLGKKESHLFVCQFFHAKKMFKKKTTPFEVHIGTSEVEVPEVDPKLVSQPA